MQKTEFEEYVNGRYCEQVRWYDRKSIDNKRWYLCLEWGLIIIAAVTPILVMMHLTPLSRYHFLNWLPVVTSGLVAVLASALKTFKFQENWANYRTTCETLRKEIHLYRFGVGAYAAADEREKFFVERVESLISRENTLWFTTYREENEPARNQKEHGA
jgi:hypothetical protein